MSIRLLREITTEHLAGRIRRFTGRTGNSQLCRPDMGSTRHLFSYKRARPEQYFFIPYGVSIWGGFIGTETNISERDVDANPSILSGNIGLSNDNTDNCYHVVLIHGGDTKTGWMDLPLQQVMPTDPWMVGFYPKIAGRVFW